MPDQQSPNDIRNEADSKLATSDNMTYIAGKGGRCITTVLPQTRGEDKTFRKALREGKVSRRTVHEKIDAF